MAIPKALQKRKPPHGNRRADALLFLAALRGLAAQTQFLDDDLIALDIFALQIVEQTAALANHDQNDPSPSAQRGHWSGPSSVESRCWNLMPS